MVDFKFHVRVPMDRWRQWVRHRMASINEFSTRYSEAIDSQQATAANEWRLQAKNNKQGSKGFVSEWPEGVQPNDMDDEFFLVRNDYEDEPTMFTHVPTPGEYLSCQERALHELSTAVYEERLKFGVAREQARKDLPLSTYTEAYWKIDLHNLFHFLGLRMDSHAQLEIRTFANAIAELIKPIVPLCWEAFEDYRLDSMQLSGPEIEHIPQLMLGD